MNKIKVEQHFRGMGHLWQNLLSLEYVLRFCILRIKGEESSMPDLENLKKGCIFKKNALLNDNCLNEVIEIFNKIFKDDGMNVNKEKIIRLRNLLGHGRIVSKDTFPMKIYKFETINKNKIKVEVAQEMSLDWFNRNNIFVSGEIRKLIKFSKSL